MSGSRKLVITILGMVLISGGVLLGKITGDTGAWAIVSVVGASMGGYAGEYLLGKRKAPDAGQAQKNITE